MFSNISLNDLYPIVAEYAKILIPSLITYLVTKYTLTRPRKYDIREKQFDLVYLPLYRLSKQLLSPSDYVKNIDSYIKKVDKIIFKNYQYVFPKTIKLFERFKKSYQEDSQNRYHLSMFEYQIQSDYEKLKRELGYPTDSVVDYFKRLNFMDKFLIIVNLLFGGIAVYAITDGIILFFAGDILNAISAFGCGFVCVALLYLLSYPKRH